jgi:hypothetical protein
MDWRNESLSFGAGDETSGEGSVECGGVRKRRVLRAIRGTRYMARPFCYYTAHSKVLGLSSCAVGYWAVRLGHLQRGTRASR